MKHHQESWSHTPAWLLICLPLICWDLSGPQDVLLYPISKIGNHLQLTSFWLLLQLRPVLAFDPLPYYLSPKFSLYLNDFHPLSEWFLSCTLETLVVVVCVWGGLGGANSQANRCGISGGKTQALVFFLRWFGCIVKFENQYCSGDPKKQLVLPTTEPCPI